MSISGQHGSRSERLGMGLRWSSNFGALRQFEGVFDIDTQITKGALNYGMTEHYLERAYRHLTASTLP